MTFTQADHDKAVELYRKYRDADWWPQTLLFLDQGVWANKLPTSKSGKVVTEDLALSAIAWAMTSRFRGVEITVYKLTVNSATGETVDRWQAGYAGTAYNNPAADTPFLALAAAVEGMEKEKV